MSKINFNNFIQVAGIIDEDEANMLISSGINFLGFPLRLPVNKEDISEEDACRLIRVITPPQFGVVIAYSSNAEEAISLCKKMNSHIIQLHGSIEVNELKKIKSISPNISIIKSLVINGNNEEKLKIELKHLELYVDAFITDTYDPVTKASGATGKTHDWEISKEFVKISSKPVILAGGLNPGNVYDAIKKVNPSGVDVHTGVENSSGRKDKFLVDKFIAESKKAFLELKI